MPTTRQPLTLTFSNRSTNPGSVCLCQPPLGLLQNGQASTEAISWAWMVAPCRPGTQIQFQWVPTYQFFWQQVAKAGSLTKAIGSQILSAEDGNQVTLQLQNKALAFSSPVEDKSFPGLTIVTDANVWQNEVMIGFAMAGAGVFGLPAKPGTTLTLSSNPLTGYYVVFGDFEEGQPLSIAPESTNNLMIRFPSGTFSGVVSLDADNTLNWMPAFSA